MYKRKSKPETITYSSNELYKYNYHYLISSIYSCFKMKVENGYDYAGESHELWELVYVINGSIHVKEDDRTYTLNNGDIIFHKPMEFHKIWCTDKNASFLIISFSCNDDTILNPLGENIFTLNIEQHETLERVYRDISDSFDVNITVYKHPDEKQDNIKERITVLNFEVFLLSLIAVQAEKNKKRYTSKENNYKIIIDVMTENIKKKLTVDDIASLCNMSTSNLKKIFNQHYSGGIIHHFNRMKINRAIYLLKLGFSVENVSASLGFANQNYFSRMFKKETGMSPSQFKQQGLS